MIRRWSEDDAEASYAVYADAVLNGAGAHYTSEQRRAWVPSTEIEPWWRPRLIGDEAWVSEVSGRLTGLIALRPDGYLDLFFVAPGHRGDGTAAALYEELTKRASERDLEGLTCHASDYLKPFLEKRGWRVVGEELAERSGVTLRRWAMVLDQLGGNQAS